MSTRQASLERRPEPPGVEAMMEDIEAVDGEDTLFRVIHSYSDDDFSPVGTSPSDSMTEKVGSKVSSPDDGNTAKPTEILTETTFLQVQRLIALQKHLAEAAHDLQVRYKHLQKQGSDVSQSLTDFRQKAQELTK